jgi:RNA polymerase sigma-70 factor (ECF subfamily)
MKARDRIADEWLVLRAQGGDPEAFEALVLRWQERLWRHAWRLSGNEEAAWDVLQETLLVMSRRIGSLKDPAAFAGWAYQIASHKCRDWARREVRERRVSEEYGTMPQQEAEDLLVQERYEEVRAAMDRLAGPERAILNLRYEEGFSTEQVAEILGVPEGTVKSRLFHARRKVLAWLKEMNDDGKK